MFVHPEQPESVRLRSEMQSLGEYLRRQESSEKTIVAGGRCFRTPSSGMTGASKGSLVSAEECTERKSEREEELERQVEEMQKTIDELSQQLDEVCNVFPEVELSSSEVSESHSRTERAFLMRSQSVPEKLLTAYKKIEVLEVTDAIACNVCIATIHIIMNNIVMPLYCIYINVMLVVTAGDQ